MNFNHEFMLNYLPEGSNNNMRVVSSKFVQEYIMKNLIFITCYKLGFMFQIELLPICGEESVGIPCDQYTAPWNRVRFIFFGLLRPSIRTAAR